MKLNRIPFALALALAAALAATGCKHGFNGKVTNLPNHRQDSFASTEPAAPTAQPPFETPQPMPNIQPAFTSTNGGTFPTSDINLDNYNQDRAALAQYTVHFKFDSSVVQDSEQSNVSSVAQAVKADPNLRLLVEGHCDERGTEEYNRALGERRALALREALAKDGLDPMYVKTISYGKDHPVDPGHDESAWAKNRRGEFVLLRPKTPVQ